MCVVRLTAWVWVWVWVWSCAQAVSYLLLGTSMGTGCHLVAEALMHGTLMPMVHAGAIISVCFTVVNMSSVLSGVARLPSFVRWVPKVNPVSYMTLNYMRALVYDGDFTVSETHRLSTNYTEPFISGADIMALRNLDADRSSYVLGVGASFAALLAWQLMFRGVAWCGIRRRAHQLQVMPTPGKVPLAELPTGVLPASRSSSMRCRVQTRRVGECGPPRPLRRSGLQHGAHEPTPSLPPRSRAALEPHRFSGSAGLKESCEQEGVSSRLARYASLCSLAKPVSTPDPKLDPGAIV